jgi:hypothetical protein
VIAWWWSWLLSLTSLLGLLTAGGDRPRLGWWLCLLGEPLVIAYAVATRQWGFIAPTLAYAAVYSRNLARVRHAT